MENKRCPFCREPVSIEMNGKTFDVPNTRGYTQDDPDDDDDDGDDDDDDEPVVHLCVVCGSDDRVMAFNSSTGYPHMLCDTHFERTVNYMIDASDAVDSHRLECYAMYRYELREGQMLQRLERLERNYKSAEEGLRSILDVVRLQVDRRETSKTTVESHDDHLIWLSSLSPMERSRYRDAKRNRNRVL